MRFAATGEIILYLYMHFKFFIALVFLAIHFYTGCRSTDKKDKKKEDNKASVISFPTSKEYNLNNPVIINLPPELNEISGISFYPKDTSIFSIIDEDGILYKIYLNRNYQVASWVFDKKHDFEDVVLHDSIFYVLISNGDIEQLTFKGNVINTVKARFPNADELVNEFETLYYDDIKGFVLICKQCEDDKKKAVSAYSYTLDSQKYSPSFTINVTAIDEQVGEQKLHLKPSAAAINPVTNDLYILCSVNKLLVVTDREGNFKNVFALNDKIYKQPEGITFTPDGDMIISNEYNKSGSANLLILKRL